MKIGKAVLVEKQLDFYHFDDGFVWNDFMNADSVKITGANLTANAVSTAEVVEIENELDGMQRMGKYYKICTNGTRAWVWMLPIHSKAYYELMKETYGEYRVSFDLYVKNVTPVDCETTHTELRIAAFGSGKIVRNQNLETWTTWNENEKGVITP